jgi:5-hydroxyisourate hydrolase
MSRLTTHVLDTANGRPAAGMTIDLDARSGEGWRRIATVRTDADGRPEAPLLDGEAMKAGRYRLVFHVAEYFARAGAAPADPPFLERVPVEFGIADPRQHYHVPLLCSPWSYSTYRGS